MASNVITLVRNLQRRQARRRHPLAVLEGIRLVEEALAADAAFRGLLVSPGLSRTARGVALREKLAAHAIPEQEIPDRELNELADTASPQGVVAVVEPRRWEWSDVVVRSESPVVVLDGLQDPGNVGTVIRTAHALGAAGVVVLRGSVLLTHPKMLRASMGATFRLPVMTVDRDDFASWAERGGVVVWAAAVDGLPVARLHRPERLAIVIGNEGAGVDPTVMTLAQKRVAIPLARGAESLNAAIAAAILLYEVVRAH